LFYSASLKHANMSENREALAADRMTRVIPDQRPWDEQIMPFRACSRNEAAYNVSNPILGVRQIADSPEGLSRYRNPIDGAHNLVALRATGHRPRGRYIEDTVLENHVNGVRRKIQNRHDENSFRISLRL
jgi:hypothetical protein